MKFIQVLLLACVALAQAAGLNLPPISTENLSRIEAGAALARANNWPVRLSSGMSEATKGSTLNVYAHQRAGQLLQGLTVIYVDYTQPANSKLVRLEFAQPGSRDDEALWANWKPQDCHSGVDQRFWEPCQRWSDQLYTAFVAAHGGTVVRQIENEPGNVVDADLNTALPYGVVKPEIRAFLEWRLAHSTGTLAAPAWETQTQDGLLNQIETENRRVWGRFSYQSINWYRTPWLSTDTPVRWAQRAIAELKAFKESYWWPGRPVVVSELGHPSIPRERRSECYKAFLRYRPAWMAVACWFDFDSAAWGVT